jgi:hypothetical protein
MIEGGIDRPDFQATLFCIESDRNHHFLKEEVFTDEKSVTRINDFAATFVVVCKLRDERNRLWTGSRQF